MDTNITLEEVEKAQQAWGAALISISKENKDKGELTEEDKTWGFKRDDSGTLRVVLHDSSLSYTA